MKSRTPAGTANDKPHLAQLLAEVLANRPPAQRQVIPLFFKSVTPGNQGLAQTDKGAPR